MAKDDEVPANPLAKEVAQHVISAWAWRLEARGLSIQTIRRELTTVKALLNHSAKLPWDLKEKDLLEWAAHLIQVRGLRGSSAESFLGTACRFLKYLANSPHVKRHLHATLGIAAKKLDDLGHMRILRDRRAIQRSRRKKSFGHNHHCSDTQAYIRPLPSEIPGIIALIEKALNSKPGAPDDND